MSSSSLVLSLRDIDGEKESLFANIRGVQRGACSPSPVSPGEVRVNLGVNNHADVRQEVYRTCVDNDVILLMLRPAEVSLEDVFLELTAAPGENRTEKTRKEAEE